MNLLWRQRNTIKLRNGDIKKENKKYNLAPAIRPFQIIKGQYLFDWDEIPGDDDKRLMYFLTKYFEIEWIKKAKVEKIDNGNTIRVFADRKSLLLRLNKEKPKVKIEFDNGRSYELAVKIENNKPNVYIGHNYTQTLEIWAHSICSEENADERVKMLAINLYRALGNINSLTLYVFEKYLGFQDIEATEDKGQKKAKEYLEWSVKSIDELIKKTTILLTPPEPKFTRITIQELNKAIRIIKATTTMGISEDIMERIMARDDSGDLDLPESDYGFKAGEGEDDSDIKW